MTIEVILNGVRYDAERIDTHDIVAGVGIRYIFVGNDWYQLSKHRDSNKNISDMRQVLASAIAREYLIGSAKSVDKIIRELQDCKYKPDDYISEWYSKFFN